MTFANHDYLQKMCIRARRWLRVTDELCVDRAYLMLNRAKDGSEPAPLGVPRCRPRHPPLESCRCGRRPPPRHCLVRFLNGDLPPRCVLLPFSECRTHGRYPPSGHRLAHVSGCDLPLQCMLVPAIECGGRRCFSPARDCSARLLVAHPPLCRVGAPAAEASGKGRVRKEPHGTPQCPLLPGIRSQQTDSLQR